MHRRTLLAVPLLFVAPSIALADVAPSPPPPIEIEAVPTVLTARTGGPTEAAYTLLNTGRAPMQVRIERVVALTPDMRLPLRITSVRPSRTLTLAPGASTEIRVAFDALTGPAASSHAWTIELMVEVEAEGHFSRYASGATTVRRIPLPG